ncbi:MAG TPA: folate-binding protein, partial [Motiliproteus sp.]
SANRSLLGANCTPKGNVISAFRLLRLDEHDLLLRLNRAIRDAAVANLRKYIVFSKATLEDAAASYQGIGLGGPRAAELLHGLFSQLPEQVDSQVSEHGRVAVRVAGNGLRYELWLPTEQTASLWQQLCSEATPVAPALWQAEEIRAGLVQLDADSVDTFLPHMLNLQAVEGISFTKGCYIGQEVVARLQYRGKLKKLLYGAQVKAAEVLPGCALHTANRLSVGKVLASVALEDGSQLLQAVINKGEADSNPLHLNSQDGPQLELLALPYPIDPALFERSGQ